MAVRIVRPTKTPTVEIGSVTCDNCGSGLEFERKDVSFYRGAPYVKCPACGRFVYQDRVPFTYTRVEPVPTKPSKRDEIIAQMRSYGLSSTCDTCYFYVDEDSKTVEITVYMSDDFIGCFSEYEIILVEDITPYKISITLENLSDDVLKQYEEKRAQLTESTIRQFELDMNEVFVKLNKIM